MGTWDKGKGLRRTRRRRGLFVVLTILVVLYGGLGCMPIALAAFAIDDAAQVAADAAGQGHNASRAATTSMLVSCDGLGIRQDQSNFHRDGTVTVSLTCNLDTPWFGWLGLHEATLQSKAATSAVVVDHPYQPDL